MIFNNGGGIDGGAIAVALDLNTGSFYKELRKAEAEATGFKKSFSAYGDLAVKAGKAWTLGLTTPIVAGFGAMAKSAIDYESAFAGVRKTTDATEAQFEQLSQAFRGMAKEIPVTASEIANIGEVAGQLGISIEHIEKFSRTMADLGVATNMSSEQAATSLARLANITGMSQENFDRLGSVVVDLGNNLATTESEIVEMGLRLAGAGKQVGMTEAEILSFAGALSSVGIEAQAGGTAFSKVMIDMQLAVETNSDRLEEFGRVAGMTGDEFSAAFKDNAPKAIMAFVTGLNDVERHGETAIKLLNDMGIEEIRLRDALLRSSAANDIFSESLEIGTKAWEENIALTKEAEQRYGTTESQIQIAKNKVADIAIELGENLLPHINKALEYIGDLTEKFANLSEEEQQSILKKLALTAAVGPLLMVLGNLSKGIGGIVGLFSSFGSAATAVGADALPAATGGVGVFSKAIGGLVSPAGLAIAAIGGIALGVHHLKGKLDESQERAEKWGEGVSAETAKALDAFAEHANEANAQLELLYINSEIITEENTGKIIGHYEAMKTEVLTKVQEQEDEVLRILRAGGSEETQMAEEYFQDKKTTTESHHAEIREIIARAERENRELTEAERRHLNIRTKQLTDEGVRIISDGEVEVEKLLAQSKGKQNAIHKEYVDKVLEASGKMNEEAIANAESGYEEQLRFALKLEAEGTESSRRLAEEVKKSAEKARDDEVRAAEERMVKTVARLNEQAGRTVAIYDAKNKEIVNIEELRDTRAWRTRERSGQTEVQQLEAYAKKVGGVYDEKTKTIISKEEAAQRATKKTADTTKSNANTVKSSYEKIEVGARNHMSGAITWLEKYNNTQLRDKSSTISVSHITSYSTRGSMPQPYATGTEAARGGLALVGELGPELVELPQGSRVNAAGRTSDIMKIDYDLLGQKVAEALERTEITVNSYLNRRDITDEIGAELSRRIYAYKR